ncbi:S1C family serine protease [Rhodohalobacter sp. SW132]|uniref:S1C family serine protease n=1 Tax=Rhodohalobacter sp. SW132 TaxID=2293433 RepID=UPI001F44448C|nr:trypsin-like peptidase domain-containing protein [Rhodohalobacter sp. SW132]
MKKKVLYNLLLILPLLLLMQCVSESENSSTANGDEPFSAAFVEENSGNSSANENGAEADIEERIHNSRDNAITAAVEKASNSVVSIMVSAVVDRPVHPYDELFRHFFGDRLQRDNARIGSGFIISDDGLVVTNQHVVGNNPTEIVISTTYGNTYVAELIGSDELTDIALLKIQSDDPFPFVEMSDSDDVRVGEWAIALGNPFGLFEDGKPTVTVGVVSAMNRDFRPDPSNPRVYLDMIQTDASINSGNSGGPLLNSNGEVIGINTFIYTGGTGAGFVGLGFAIPSNRIDRIITQLLTSGSVMLDYNPGLKFTSMTEQLVYRYRLPYVQGLLVTEVNKDGPAFESGIMPGDIILRIGGERVVGEMHAWALLREYNEGDEMDIELLRDNNRYETEIYLRKRITAEQTE